MKEHLLYLLLGSNLGDKKKQLDQAINLIAERIGQVVRRSSVYETEPWGFSSENIFLNLALQIHTFLSPEEVMQKIHEIEKQFGRKRTGKGYSSRKLDIDILFYDDLILNQVELKIPHPLIQERRFVLVPLDEIAHGLIHPVLRKDIGQLLCDCSDRKEVRKIED